LNGPLTFVVTSDDTAFIGAKRGQCGAVYARAESLRQLGSGLHRDRLAFRFLPLWITEEELVVEKKAIEARHNRERQEQEERDRWKWQEGHDKDRRQKDLQLQFGPMARLLEGKLRVELRDYLEGRSERAGRKYPQIRSWLEARKSEQWELMTVDTSLEDYGIAEFKGRSLEAAFARTKIKMRNRMEGEYREQCFVTAFLADAEFEVERQPMSSNCEDRETLAKYRLAQRFTSRWLVQ